MRSQLGVDPALVDVIVDTTRELGAGQTTGSRGTLMGAGSVADACRSAIADGCRTGGDYEGEYRVDWTNSMNEGLENPIIHSTFGYAAQMVVLDPETGDVDRVVAAHDVGRAVNPMLCEGQVEGAVHMGLGYALTEGFPAPDVLSGEENKARAETAGTPPANLSASCDTDTFVLLMYGRFSLESAVAAGRMTAEGNQGLMTGFDQWLAGH